MSLIAEALRKSEAERRRGQVPSLISLEEWTPRPRQRATRRGPSFVAGVVVALLAVAGAVAWFLPALRERLAGPPPAPTAAAAVDETATRPVSAPAATAPASTTPAALPTVDARPSDRVTSVTVAPSAPVAVEPVAVETPRPPPPTPVPTTTTTAATTPESAPPFRSPAPPPAYERSSTPAGSPPPAVATPSEPVAGVPATPPAATEHVPLLAELSDGQRAALPALKLNMHVYARDPSNRFVLVNGNRLAEGESGSDGVRVIEIRPDGVVVDARSVRVFLPRG